VVRARRHQDLRRAGEKNWDAAKACGRPYSRALLKNAPILVLDEATSALDAENEEKVQEALGRLTHGRTTFIVAHRLSTVVSADQILVVKDGAIAERGTHGELVRAGGYYATLTAKQRAGLPPEPASHEEPSYTSNVVAAE
jgi:ABC-type multidrug transport system ATPase subunit